MGGPGSGRKRVYNDVPIMNYEKLMEAGKRRGYRTPKDLCKFLADKVNYHKSWKKFYNKIMYKSFTYRDILLISDSLELTAGEFLAIWFPTAFHEDKDKVIRFKLPDDIRQMVLDKIMDGFNASKARNGKLVQPYVDPHKVRSEIADFLKNIE